MQCWKNRPIAHYLTHNLCSKDSLDLHTYLRGFPPKATSSHNGQQITIQSTYTSTSAVHLRALLFQTRKSTWLISIAYPGEGGFGSGEGDLSRLPWCPLK